MSTVFDARRRPTFDLRHRLVLAREVAEMEQAQVAEALGVSRQTVSNYERGFTQPRRATVLAWAMATGVDTEWLERGTENPRPDNPGGGSLLPGLDSNQEPIG
ncbi:helix-turn-helix transcriptional regulator [Microbacterium sp. ru370.1]|uniref:helix-turn-helix transcriptional regulator n=1 Tax=unclassified Microbacterium TaxID=2609290 RepID=UPI000977E329